jgi:hypothetical protein
VHDLPAISNLAVPWPALAQRLVVVGGLPVTYAEALRAAEILLPSRTSAIAPVLRSAGSPLAGCDYFAAAAPYLDAARRAPKTGRAGAAGRHVTKNAFIEAVTLVLAVAREQEVAAGLDAFAADERYATAIARDAVAARERAYLTGVRSSVRAAVTRAVAACGAAQGLFTCSEATACGTGACRFSAPAHRLATASAGAGKFVRPANHTEAGRGFTEAGAAAELAAAGGYRAGVQVWDTDRLAA